MAVQRLALTDLPGLSVTRILDPSGPGTVQNTCWTVLASQESLVAGTLKTPVAPLFLNQSDLVGFPPSFSYCISISALVLYMGFFCCR